MSVRSTISEVEAVKVAGISARTLQRFCEAGYLTVEVQVDGERLYQTSQLREIFGAFREEVAPAQQPLQEVLCEIQPAEPSSSPQCDLSGNSEPCVERSPVDTETPPVATPASREASSPLQEENARLQNLLSLQERILDMKDAELRDLRSQRDWLRTRIERLEEKGDRDQVLLLSETQAIRQLIGLQSKRQSKIRNILEWLGLSASDSISTLPSNQDVAGAIALERNG